MASSKLGANSVNKRSQGNLPLVIFYHCYEIRKNDINLKPVANSFEVPFRRPSIICCEKSWWARILWKLIEKSVSAMAFTVWLMFSILSDVASKSEVNKRIVSQTLPILLEGLFCPKIDHNFPNENSSWSVQSQTHMFQMVPRNYWILFLSCTFEGKNSILNQTRQRMSLSTSC